MKKILPAVLWLTLITLSSLSQSVDTVFTMAKTTVFTTNTFSSIGVGKNNTIWVGTSLQGLYKFDGEVWEKAPVLTNHNINHIKTGKLGSIWIAQSGSSGAQAIGGGIFHFPSGASFNGAVAYNVSNGQLPTRNVRSLYVDSSRFPYGTFNGLQTPNLPIWAAHMADLTGGVSKTGAVSRGVALESPLFKTIKAGVETAGGIGSVQIIGGNTEEVWAFALNNFGRNQILRYSYISGLFRGYYDYTNVNPDILAQTFSARAIYFDPNGRKWIGLATGEIVVNENGKWYKFNLPSPLSGVVNNNGITGDKAGNVYIGRTDGLYIYVGGPVNDVLSYKRFDVSNGLPSNNVRSIAVDDKQRIWVATDAGIARMSSPFTVYNLKHPDTNPDLKNLILKQLETLTPTEANTLGLRLLQNDDKYKVTEAVDKTKDIYGKPISINVAADSSTSTLIFYKGAGASTKEFKVIIGNTEISFDGTYQPDRGQFVELIRRNDTLVYLYKHPSHVDFGTNQKFADYGFKFRDKNTLEITYEGNFNIYHAPVLLVHGVWSSIESMEEMEKYLKTTSLNYYPYQVKRWWYLNSNHTEKSAVIDSKKIPEGIDRLLEECRVNKLSAGKVNVVGHSRGGLYTRLYLQSAYLPYRNDIKSLITINTPHFGSQGANLLLDFRKVYKLITVGELLGDLVLGKVVGDPNGALELKVNCDLILNKVNSTSNVSTAKIPVHAIVSQKEFGLSKSELMKIYFSNSGSRIPLIGTYYAGLRKLSLLLANGPAGGTVDLALKQIYNGEGSDIIVALSSQQGGLNQKDISDMGLNLAHSKLPLIPSVLDVVPTYQELTRLLQQNPFDPTSNFTTEGFKPPSKPLEYTLFNGLGASGRSSNSTSETITINPSLKGSNYTSGQSVLVPVNASSNISTIMVEYKGVSVKEASSDVEANTNFSFNYPIPKEAAGRMDIIAYGFNAGGLVAVDSSYINVGIPASAVLDSIRFERNGNPFFEVPARDSISFNVLGYFSDTVRNITGLPGLQYSFFVGGAASLNNPNNIKGEIPNTLDLLSATYLNKSDTIEVQVTDSIEVAKSSTVLPTKLLSFTASSRNRQTHLLWKTSVENNTSRFDIEHSTNGSLFTIIGKANAAGSSTVYTYVHDKPQPGIHYYRLKMVDRDGTFEYSPVRVILVNSSIAISLYPNPVKDNMTFQLSSDKKADYQVQVLSIEGKVLQASKIKNADSYKQTINVSSLSKGFYLLKVSSKDDQSIIKFEKM